MARLSAEELRAALAGLPGWEEAGDAIEREFSFRTFRQAMAFANAVADIAHAARHHPDILIRYNRVRLTLSTHDEGGVTEQDIAFARAADAAQGQGQGQGQA
ncbi:MAG TPA: 4a-hydroxytetrahydrobiopterin dehydratase [Thermomicrobiaceae bacterium]|nr:4a-hydroxytetrahydrobiopterin dehydratase [Thermomicrobiaceae bacterium]